MIATPGKIELFGGALCGAIVDWPSGSNRASFHVNGVDFTYGLEVEPTILHRVRGYLISQE